MKRAEEEEGSKHMPDRISDLPQGILQRILYFLTQKEAARTSVLSKSWRYIWCTRPNLDFSYDSFNGSKRRFISVVDNTLQQYCDQRLCVEEFHLRMPVGYDLHLESVSLLHKWIPRFTAMGTKKFCLSIRGGCAPGRFKLPSVVFRAKSLHGLHLEGFVLDKTDIGRIIHFKHLRSLRLEKVYIDDEIFQKIISNCHLIETLHIERSTTRLRTVNVNALRHLKEFNSSGSGFDTLVPYQEFDTLVPYRECCSFEICPPSIETIYITFGTVFFSQGADLCNLTVVFLSCVKLSPDHLSSCRFSSLKRLTLYYCDGFEEIQTFINAPNILYFYYVGDFVPLMSFATTLNEWKSDICVLPDDASSSWFLELKELLKSLSQSRINLTIDYSDDGEEIIQDNIVVQDNSCNKPVVVESLSLYFINLNSVSPLFNAALCICRPRIIRKPFKSEVWEPEVVECLWNILMQRDEDDDQLWKRDLDEVSMEIKETNRKGKWRTVAMSDLQSYEQREDIGTRFALKWIVFE